MIACNMPITVLLFSSPVFSSFANKTVSASDFGNVAIWHTPFVNKDLINFALPTVGNTWFFRKIC